MRRCVLTALCLLLSAQAGNCGEVPPMYAIRGARIVPVSGPVIEQGTLLMDKGLIVAIGKDTAIPAEADVLDGKGLTVFPGLIDGWTDLGTPPPPLAPGAPGTPASGVYPSGDKAPEDRPGSTPWVQPAFDLKPDDKRLEAWRKAGFTLVLNAPRKGILPGQGTLLVTAGTKASELVVRPSAAIPVTFQTQPHFPSSLMGVHSYLRQVFLDARHDQTVRKAYEQNPKGKLRPLFDRTTQTLSEALDAGGPVLLPATTQTQIVRALTLSRNLGVPPVLYGVHQGYAASEDLAKAQAWALISLKWPEREKEADPELEDSIRTLRFREQAPATPAALAKAGVRFAFYSDGLPNPEDAIKGVRRAIQAGLSPERALRALTLDAATLFQVSDRLGSLEPGKVAHVVVTEGEPLGEKTKVRLVFVDGRKFVVPEPPKPAVAAPSTTDTAAPQS